MSRQTASLWFWIKHDFAQFMRLKMYRHPYFWQDTLWTHWNNAIGCRLFGHRKARWIYDGEDHEKQVCFGCYRTLGYRPRDKSNDWKPTGFGKISPRGG